jgi:hypothetical protein
MAATRKLLMAAVVAAAAAAADLGVVPGPGARINKFKRQN